MQPDNALQTEPHSRRRLCTVVAFKASEHRIVIGGLLGHWLHHIPMLDHATVLNSKNIDDCKPKVFWRRLAMIMNGNQVVGRDDTVDSEDPVRISFQKLLQEIDDRFAAVGKSGLVLYIVRINPGFEGLSDLFFPIKQIDKLANNFTGRHRAIARWWHPYRIFRCRCGNSE